MLSTVRWDLWQCEEKSPKGLYLQRKTPSASGQMLYTLSDLLYEGDWKGEGRGRVKTAILLFFPTQSPLLLPGVAFLLWQNPGGNKQPHGWGIQEKCLYQVLLLWLFLQFLNFKWEHWNTDIDMKRFIVTIHHYYHRPYCYYSLRKVLVSAIEDSDGSFVQSAYVLTAYWR